MYETEPRLLCRLSFIRAASIVCVFVVSRRASAVPTSTARSRTRWAAVQTAPAFAAEWNDAAAAAAAIGFRAPHWSQQQLRGQQQQRKSPPRPPPPPAAFPFTSPDSASCHAAATGLFPICQSHASRGFAHETGAIPLCILGFHDHIVVMTFQDAPPLPRRMSTSDRSSTSSVQSLPQQQQQQQHRPMQQPPRHSQGSSCQARPQYGHPYGGSQQTQPPPLPPPKAAKEETSPLPPPLPSR